MSSKKWNTLIASISCLLMLSGFSSTAFSKISVSSGDANETASLVADMIISGRGVVARHQGLINDPTKGDKGFTPDYFEEKIRAAFEKKTGSSIEQINNPTAKEAVLATLNASREAVKNNQGRINQKGKKFKGFIPAVYGRVAGNILKGKTGIDVKQTTHKYRNNYNMPDEYEDKILTDFENTKPKVGHGEMSGDSYRYMAPVYIKEACLKCHGFPIGELDIAGKKKEGYKVGDLRGAISVNIPIN
jgi:hypothetical protein